MHIYLNAEESKEGVLWKTVWDDAKTGSMVLDGNTASQEPKSYGLIPGNEGKQMVYF